MKIGVISDTHDRLPTLEHAFAILKAHKVRMIIHCGDWTKTATLCSIVTWCKKHDIRLCGVFGNRDDCTELASALPQRDGLQAPEDDRELEVKVDNRNLAIYHGHNKSALAKITDNSLYDAVFTGHTHKPSVIRSDTNLVVNPGSTAFSIPRKKEPRSLAIYDTFDNSAEIYYFE
jgi:putative phosphoesterase